MNAARDDESDVLATGWRTNAVRSSDVQTVQRKGREYLQFPMVPLTEMVYDYPENGTKEYLPAKHIRETAGLWDGTLLTYVHPENRNRTVRDPDAFMGSVIGAFHDPSVVDGGEKLRGNGLIDVEKAKALGGTAAELVDLLQRGEEVSVSAGYSTAGDTDESRSGRFDGEQYAEVQGPPLPDHIAIFPSDSKVQARCSPEDGCAAPRANAYQDKNGQEATMSETESESDVPTTEEQRQMTNELTSMLDSVASSGVATDRQADELRRLRNVVDGLGQMLEQGETDVGPALGAVVRESKALVADILNETETTEPTDEKANAGATSGECDCAGVCRHNPSISGSDGTGESLPRVNMLAVPGGVRRDLDQGRGQQTEDAEAYPAGGRKAWERRQVGLPETPDDDEYPAGGRSAWEARKASKRVNAEQSAAETQPSAAARRSANARQNAVDVSEVASAEYPLTRLIRERQRAEKRRRWAELREQSKSNYARHTDQ